MLVANRIAARRFRREVEARPRLQAAEFDRIEAEMERLRLPLCRLVPTEAPPAPQQSRIGGGPWAPEGAFWPVDREGRPMLFLAQINFAEASGLDDFPDKGLLQVFLPADERGGEHWGEGDNEEERLIRWFEDPQGGTVLPVLEVFTSRRSRSPLRGRARREGVTLRSESDIVPPLPHNFPLWEIEPDIHTRLPADAEAEARAKAWEARVDKLHESYGAHWISGHPSFVQEDVRISAAALRELDRVLLHLGPDEFLTMGDSGELNLLIRRDDLLARRFERAHMTFDCA